MLKFTTLLIDNIEGNYDSIVLAVSHKEFLNIDFLKFKQRSNVVIFDTKSFIDRKFVDGRL
jgi:UDP-N-acetyl-D-galactosamine dehydrogenase